MAHAQSAGRLQQTGGTANGVVNSALDLVPRNSARLRFCVISEHKPEQIIHALDTLMETADEMGINIRKREEK